MQRARAAVQMGQMAMALAFEQQALALALRLVQQTPPAGREDDCIAALVVSHLNVADLQVQAAEPDVIARVLKGERIDEINGARKLWEKSRVS